MPHVKAASDTDEQGRRRIVGYTTNPDSPRTKDPDAIEVDSMNKPDLEPHQRATPWLRDDGQVEWDIEERPDDDPAQMARRLSQVEAAIGSGGDQGQRGIAHRLDDLEDRIAALEDT